MSSFSDMKTSSDEKKIPLEDGEILTPEVLKNAANRRTSLVSKEGTVVNASGHKDQLQRQYGTLSICGLALTIDNGTVVLFDAVVAGDADYRAIQPGSLLVARSPSPC